MREKIISGKKIINTITSEDILGKEVIDSEGRFIGVDGMRPKPKNKTSASF